MNHYEAGSSGLLKPLEPWLNDPTISEILLNKPEEIWIEQEGQLIEQKVPALNQLHLNRLFQLIANENKQVLSTQYPLLSGNLHDGTRVQLCLPPVARYPTFSIRRKVVRHLSLNDYEEKQFYHKAKIALLGTENINNLSEEDKDLLHLFKANRWHEFIKKAIESKKNIVISGGTSSGKTTYLNACLSHIPLNERIIVLEDTREIEIAHPNQVQLLAHKGEQGEAQISMQDLVQCCLRLRPDRIIMGEIRGKEILDFISACSTGHEGSLTTIHANNPQIAFMRMTQMYKLNNVPFMTDQDILRELHSVIDVVIQLAKTSEGRQVQSVYYRYGNL